MNFEVSPPSARPVRLPSNTFYDPCPLEEPSLEDILRDHAPAILPGSLNWVTGPASPSPFP
jgi:hypothetical protein